MSARGFLWLNQDGGGREVTTEARAFVTRKARAEQPWSTKSRQPVDKRKGEHRLKPWMAPEAAHFADASALTLRSVRAMFVVCATSVLFDGR